MTSPVYHATPERLVETVLSTYDNGKAVKFLTDDSTIRGVYTKINAMVTRHGRKLVMQSQRPRHHAHRVKSAPYEVIMWIEERNGG